MLSTEHQTLENSALDDPTLENLTLDLKPVPNRATQYKLKWRQKQLLVKLSRDLKVPCLPPLTEQSWLQDCLQRSPVHLVKLPLELPETELEFWADACAAAGKSVFLKLPGMAALPNKRSRIKWWIKRLTEWAIAALLLILFSPLMLILSWLIVTTSPGPVLFHQWRVGERGKLFRIYKFRTMVAGAEQLHHQVMVGQSGLHKLEHDPRITPLGVWMRRYSLDELPQLINVLRGEMSLVGPRPWALYDALRLSPTVRHRLNALPGITGIWQITRRATLRDLDAVNRIDLGYLGAWSFRQDLKILLLTIPKVLTGFGAY
ncbi:sugar transferase [Leptothermofonsia sichuanensis E412]|uniref:heterocyst development glycosyltransferase HepC n=1 Tax=Leptothermofonsia sichuanensis TaxID=2917832 RepID=UPI001CA636A5|nr:heterocyst development glycosyltransferase HepC [Leptothermofonsia sichuanensis]QZZ20055.1 sugar transferase [Leptothermofonsia sichuanensis E412]